MKNLFNFSNSIFIAWILLIGMSAFTGCETTQSVKVTSAQSILVVQTAVHNAMSGYSNLVALGKISKEDRVKVSELYFDYESAEDAAISALQIGTHLGSVTTPESMERAFDALINLLATFE
jgi:hypothetical protein